MLAIAGVKFFPEHQSERATADKTSRDFIWDDEGGNGITALTDQIDEIEASILAIRLGEKGSEGSTILTDLEMEMSEINGNFWKG